MLCTSYFYFEMESSLLQSRKQVPECSKGKLFQQKLQEESDFYKSCNQQASKNEAKLVAAL